MPSGLYVQPAPGRSNSGGYNPAYGGIPTLPDIGQSAINATNANKANWKNLAGFASGVNSFNYNQLMSQILQGFPGYTEATSKASKNIQDDLAGIVPEDVKYNLGQAAAERGVSRGGQFTEADYLKGLGLTSLERKDLGAKKYEEMLAGTPRTTPFDISRMLVDPNTMYEAEVQQAIMRSAPDPYAKAMAELGAVLSGVKQGQRQTAPGAWSMPSPAANIMQKYGSSSWGQPDANYSSGGIRYADQGLPITTSTGSAWDGGGGSYTGTYPGFGAGAGGSSYIGPGYGGLPSPLGPDLNTDLYNFRTDNNPFEYSTGNNSDWLPADLEYEMGG